MLSHPKITRKKIQRPRMTYHYFTEIFMTENLYKILSINLWNILESFLPLFIASSFLKCFSFTPGTFQNHFIASYSKRKLVIRKIKKLLINQSINHRGHIKSGSSSAKNVLVKNIKSVIYADFREKIALL